MKIFISVASYQDPLLLETLCSAYTNARFKDSLVFGVCEQADQGIDLDSIVFKDQIKYELLDPVMAKGPCWARGRIQQYYSDEEFFLQIDSHTILKQIGIIFLLKIILGLKILKKIPLLSAGILENLNLTLI